MAASRRPPYEYLELGEACARQGYQNVYALVAEFSVPRLTRGTDYVCNLVLVDPAEGMQRPVDMVCFAPQDWQLPRVQKPGDIIRLHRVKVQMYNDRPQFMGKLGHSAGPPFAFCLFVSSPTAGNSPYQTSSQHFHWDEREARILAAMRHYVAASNAYHLAPPSEYVRTIKDVRPQTFVDLVCRVLAYGDAFNRPNWRVMHVWDGTDALPHPFLYDTRMYDEEGLAPELRQHIRELAPLALPLGGDAQESLPLGEVPLLGTALPVVVQGDLSMLGSQRPAVGSWIKLRNVGVRVVQGQLQGYYTRGSKWAPWAEEAEAMSAYQHRVQRNEVAGWAPASCAELLALCRYDSRPFTPLRRILLDTPCGVPRKYRALVRVADWSPAEPAQMCHTTEECGLGGPSGAHGSGARYVWTLRLLLEDATGQLDAVLYGSEATAFFEGLAPCDLAANPQQAERVEDRLQVLVGKGCERTGGPWIDVCLKAYYVEGVADPWQARQYQICDTHMRQHIVAQGAG